jgi:hypothetical protein
LFCDSWDLLPLNLVFVKIGYAVDYDPGKTAAKVDRLVHDEAENTGREDIVLHVGIPALRGLLANMKWRSRADTYDPQALEDVQVNTVFGEFVVYTHVGIGSCKQRRVRHGVHEEEGGMQV